MSRMTIPFMAYSEYDTFRIIKMYILVLGVQCHTFDVTKEEYGILLMPDKDTVSFVTDSVVLDTSKQQNIMNDLYSKGVL